MTKTTNEQMVETKAQASEPSSSGMKVKTKIKAGEGARPSW